MQIQKDNDIILKSLYRYCSGSEKCRSDIELYLHKFDLGKNEQVEVIKNLEDNNFINETRYAEAFVNDKLKFNKWGRIKICYALKSKKINDKIIEKALATINEDIYSEILYSVLKKKLSQISGKEKSIQKQLILNFGMSRGFESENIIEILKKLRT